MKRIILGLTILAVFIATISPGVKAEAGGVTLTAMVIEKKPTDTINDFNFSKINPNSSRVIAIENNALGAVKGTSTKQDNYLLRLMVFFKSIFN